MPDIGFSDPTAGIYKIEIKQGWNLISIPMQTLQRTQGKITSLGSNTVTDSTKSWTEDAYQYDILIISSGSGEGYYYRISSNTTTQLTLSSSLSSSISAGDYFYVYKAFTLTELFGDLSVGDEIYLWNASTQAFSTVIHRYSDGWYQGGTKLTTKEITLIPNEGCFVVRNTASTATVNYVGIVPDTMQTSNIKSGDNTPGESFPTSVTITDSGLSSVLHAGTSSYTADNVHKWNYSNQQFDLPMWYSSYTGYTGWYQGSSSCGSTNLSPAEGFMIKNRSSETNWQRSKPYSAP